LLLVFPKILPRTSCSGKRVCFFIVWDGCEKNIRRGVLQEGRRKKKEERRKKEVEIEHEVKLNLSKFNFIEFLIKVCLMEMIYYFGAEFFNTYLRNNIFIV